MIGKECQVQDPRYNSTIDLNSLRNEREDITLPLEANLSPSVRFNLCGPLVKSCNGISNTSFCLYKNGSEYAIGKSLLSKHKCQYVSSVQGPRFYILDEVLLCNLTHFAFLYCCLPEQSTNSLFSF